MNIGDLVRHVHLGGCGLVVDTRMKHSSHIGWNRWLVIEWFQSPTQRGRDVYMPVFLEHFKPTDKKV